MALIVLTHGSISREHATITVSASGSVVVVDLGSAQGTKISGKPLVPNKPHLLPPGRSLTFAHLQAGGSGFVSGEAGAAAVARAPQSAASIDDPRVQPVLLVLRAGASDCERPRPDGVMRLMSVVASAAVQRVGCTELELASLPARFVNVFETITEAGVLLLRALDGHEPSLRVQPRLQLVPDPSPPSILFFGFNVPRVECGALQWRGCRAHAARPDLFERAPAAPGCEAPGCEARFPRGRPYS